MAIRFRCSDCDKALKVEDQHAGRRLRCPGCETVLRIPASRADRDGEEEFFDDDEDAEESTAASRKSATRAARAGATSARAGQPRRKKSNEGENYFRSARKKPTKKSKPANNNAVLVWSIVIGGGVLALSAVGAVIVVALNWSSAAGPSQAVAAQGKPTPPPAQNSKYVTAETTTPVSKFKMVWDMPAKWTQQSGVEEGFWPWAEMKGQGQVMKITSNRSLTEASSTMTSIGGFTESLKTAHTVRLGKLKLEYNDFEEGPLNLHEGKYGPVVWSEYEYKGMFGKGYGIRCTLPGPRLPCTLVMEYAQSARDKWRPTVLDVASSVRFEKTGKDEDDAGDFFIPDAGGADLGGGPADGGGNMPADQGGDAEAPDEE